MPANVLTASQPKRNELEQKKKRKQEKKLKQTTQSTYMFLSRCIIPSVCCVHTTVRTVAASLFSFPPFFLISLVVELYYADSINKI